MKSDVVLTVFLLLDYFSDAQQIRSCRLPAAESNGGGGVLARRYCPSQCLECQEAGACHSPPGSLIVSPASTRVQCAPGYRLDDDKDYTLAACDKGTWVGRFPECLAQCTPLVSDSVLPRCVFNEREVDCGNPVMPGTSATVECKPNHSKFPSFERAGLYNNTLYCRSNGKWSHTMPRCKPVCGISNGVNHTSGDVNPVTQLGTFPWHAAIYRKNGSNWTYICAGSLITKRVVLSAAHCMLGPLTPQDVWVAFAKIRRPWEEDEAETIKRSVSAIVIPGDFHIAKVSLTWDLSLLLLSEPVHITTNIMPACLDFNLQLTITRGTKGYMTGYVWNNDLLRHNDISIVPFDEKCEGKLPGIWRVFQFCGSSAPLVAGNGGAGLTVVVNGLHHVLGVTSVKYENTPVFTNITSSKYAHWIESEINNRTGELQTRVSETEVSPDGQDGVDIDSLYYKLGEEQEKGQEESNEQFVFPD